MNIFNRIAAREFTERTHLGRPARDEGERARRMQVMFAATGGNGFRIPKKGPKLRGGQTRRERKAVLRSIYRDNLLAEASLRKDMRSEGYSIAQINRAIEEREHMPINS